MILGTFKAGMREERGLTLIELAIVTIIAGILIAGAARAFSIYYKQAKIEQQNETVDNLASSLAEYFGTNGWYPCPASLTAGPGDAEYGVPTDCEDQATVATEGCNAHYCVVRGNFDHDNDPVTPPQVHRVRIGAVPFRFGTPAADTDGDGDVDGDDNPNVATPANGLDIDGQYALDPYGNRILYALTENQGTVNYVKNLGAIRIINEHNNEIVDGAEYALVALGADGKGAYNWQGTPGVPCDDAPGRDQNNCQEIVAGEGDGVFVSALRSEQQGNGYFDDTVVYRPWVAYFNWENDDRPGGNPRDVQSANIGNVGIGTDLVEDADDPQGPEERLHVRGGHVMAKRRNITDPDDPNPKSPDKEWEQRYAGNLFTDEVCDKEGNNCFTPDLIGGEKMDQCQAFEAMRGVAAGQSKCEPTLVPDTPEASATCPAGYFMYGFSYNGSSKQITARCVDVLTGDKI